MIVVRNTKELEENYDLSLIHDDEAICVLGGFADKSKYNSEKYQMRTTYSGRQLKQIIQQMKDIEDTIPENWNQWQRAKYIYITLAANIEYNYDRESYKTQQYSNLTVLMRGKAICAGYSLTFKEMMDRQGITCEYIRGVAGRNFNEKHAWNILQIGDITIPVDLTWDSAKVRAGEQLRYFGNNRDFFQAHMQDNDEKRYSYSLISDESVNSIDISNLRNREQLDGQEQINELNLAIEQTYEKFANMYGDEAGKKQVTKAIKMYLKEASVEYFTRQGGSRDGIIQNFRPETMLDLLVKQYIQRCNEIPGKSDDILKNASMQTLLKYGQEHAEKALKKFILSGCTNGFTRQNNARFNIEQYMSRRKCNRYNN